MSVFKSGSRLPVAVLCLGMFTQLAQAHLVRIPVSIDDNGFHPEQIEIMQGAAIIFENQGNQAHWPASDVHPTHEIYPVLDTKRPLAPGLKWGFVFKDEGTWSMHDHLNPHFKTTVTVIPHVNQGQTSTIDASSSTHVVNLEENPVPDPENEIVNYAETTAEVVKFHRPPSTDSNQLYQALVFECADTDFKCTADALRSLTKEYGPAAATATYGFTASSA